MKRTYGLNKSVSLKEQQFNRTDSFEIFLLLWLMAVQFIQLIGSRLLEVRSPSSVEAMSGLWWSDNRHVGRYANEEWVPHHAKSNFNGRVGISNDRDETLH